MGNVTAKDIVHSVGLSSEIEAHLTTPQDFDGDKLYDIFIQIATCIGNDQAIAFANMIRTVEPLSTVNLLHTLYQLEEAGWDYCFSYSTAKKRREFLSHFGKEEDPREKKWFDLKDDDFER